MKIWDYINLNKAENKIKKNTELEIFLIATALAAPIVLAATPVVLAAALITLAAAFIALVIAFIAPVVTLASIKTATSALLSQ